MKPVFVILLAVSLGIGMGGCSNDDKKFLNAEQEYYLSEILWMMDESKGDGGRMVEDIQPDKLFQNRTEEVRIFEHSDTLRSFSSFTFAP